jgi:hypothetical protein
LSGWRKHFPQWYAHEQVFHRGGRRTHGVGQAEPNQTLLGTALPRRLRASPPGGQVKEVARVTSRIGSRGSFVIAAMCQDGVVVVSESRASIFDKTDQNQTPIAYYDICQKVFPIRNLALAETGQGLILNVFFSAIVEDFTQALVRQPSALRLLPTFVQFCQARYPAPLLVEIRRQKLFGAGYEDGRPLVCYFNEEQEPGPFGCIKDAGFIESAPTSFADHADALPSMSCNEVAAVARQAIEEFASDGDHWKTIGGPLDVLHVTAAGCHWVQKSTPAQDWRYVQDFVRSYHQGQATITLIPPATKRVLDDLLATVTVADNRAT